jgi:hypothetical protein
MEQDKQKVLNSQWAQAQKALDRADAAFSKAQRRYMEAVESGNRIAISETSKSRAAAGAELRSAQVKESELRYACGHEAWPDTLRHQVGKY